MGKKKGNQPSQKEIVKSFKPSKGDESYLQSSKGLETEVEDWGRIQLMWAESRQHAEKAILIFMDIGDILLVLREGKTDPVFGNLRTKYVPELSRQDATRAMNMARNRKRFPTKSKKTLPSISVFAELVNASDTLVEETIAKTADPEEKTPTVKEVREEVKKEKEPESADEFENSIVDLDDGIEPDDDLVEDDELPDVGQPPLAIWVEQMLEKPLTQRIAELREEELDTVTALVLLGFNPLHDGDYPCSREVFLAAINHHLTTTNEEDARIANHCAKIVERELWN